MTPFDIELPKWTQMKVTGFTTSGPMALEVLQKTQRFYDFPYLVNSPTERWIHPNGTVGSDYNVGPNPTVREIFEEWELIAAMFPTLNLRAVLMSGEALERSTYPLVEFTVLNGSVRVRPYP